METVQPVSLFILVGLTGTGKTTTVHALQDAELGLALLPNRRALTDQLIIGHLQKRDGEPVRLVTDRATRFAYTRRYRELYPGGMAQALVAWLSVNDKDSLVNGESLPLFDGLRGENEATYAATHLPQARFLFLTAPDFVRVQRLVQRRDEFDAVKVADAVDTAVLRDLAAGILRDSELDLLLAAVRNGRIAATDLQAKLTIVRSERQNYDPDATLAALQRLAPARLIVADTVQLSPAQIAQRVRAEFAL